MKSNFTPEDLIAHLYNETKESDREAIENWLAENPERSAEFELLQKTKQALSTEKRISPSKSSIDIILEYARNVEKEEESLHH